MKHKQYRATLKMRLHFLFTGELPGYWYNAQADVFQAYLNYYMSKDPKDAEDEARIDKCVEVFSTHRFNKKMIEDYIIPNRKGFSKNGGSCGSGIRYFNYFSKSWLKKDKPKHTVPAHSARIPSDTPEENPIEIKPYKQGKYKTKVKQ